jgi:O-antigen/teichoic acid export membrane protein
LVAAGTVIVNIAVLLVGSGTRGSIIVADRVTVEHLRYALAINVGAGLVLTLGVMLLAGPIVATFASGADASVLQVLILSVGVFAWSVVPLAVLQREMRFKQEASVRAGSAIIASIVAIAAAVLGAGVWALVLRQVLASALTALFAWIAARRLLPGWRQMIGRARRPMREHRPDAGWFFFLAMFNMIAMSVDYLIVGHLTNATQLGLYSLAFTLGFAPLTQFSWRLGVVILPAVAATVTTEDIQRRTLRALHTVAVILLPVVPVAIVLAPWLLPAVFGHKWAGMVTPFEILLPVGVAHAVVNMIGESLSGTGNVAFHTKMQVVFTVLIIPALIVLVQLDGIVGASFAHLAVSVPVACGYLIWGARRIGLGARQVLASLGPVLLAIAGQAAATFAVATALGQSPVSAPVGELLAALAGLGVAWILAARLGWGGLRDTRRLVLAAVGR